MSARRIGKIASALLAAVLAVALLAQSASAGTLYTTNYNDRQLAALSIGPDGLLTPLAGSPYPIAHFDYGIGITPDGRLLIPASGFDHFLESFALGADGTPSLATAPLPAPIFGPVAITPDGRFAYFPADPKGVAGYSIGAGGSLTPVGAPVGADSGPVAITPDGRFLFVVAYPSGDVERFAIGADGTLTPLTIVPLSLDQGSDEMRITPDGRFAVLLSRHIAAKEDLRTLAIGSDGSVTPTGAVLQTVGNTSGMLIISPNGRFAYVANGNEASVSTYSIGPAGQLAPVGETVPTGLSQPASLAMSVDGRFLYAEPQGGEKIQAFSVAADGTLTKIGEPAPTGGTSDNQTPVARPSDPVASFVATPGPPHGPTSLRRDRLDRLDVENHLLRMELRRRDDANDRHADDDAQLQRPRRLHHQPQRRRRQRLQRLLLHRPNRLLRRPRRLGGGRHAARDLRHHGDADEVRDRLQRPPEERQAQARHDPPLQAQRGGKSRLHGAAQAARPPGRRELQEADEGERQKAPLHPPRQSPPHLRGDGEGRQELEAIPRPHPPRAAETRRLPDHGGRHRPGRGRLRAALGQRQGQEEEDPG